MGMSKEEADSLQVGDVVTISSPEEIENFSLMNGRSGKRSNGDIDTPCCFVSAMNILAGASFVIEAISDYRRDGEKAFYLKYYKGGDSSSWSFDRFMLVSKKDEQKFILDEEAEMQINNMFEDLFNLK